MNLLEKQYLESHPGSKDAVEFNTLDELVISVLGKQHAFFTKDKDIYIPFNDHIVVITYWKQSYYNHDDKFVIEKINRMYKMTQNQIEKAKRHYENRYINYMATKRNNEIVLESTHYIRKWNHDKKDWAREAKECEYCHQITNDGHVNTKDQYECYPCFRKRG